MNASSPVAQPVDQTRIGSPARRSIRRGSGSEARNSHASGSRKNRVTLISIVLKSSVYSDSFCARTAW